MHKKSWGNVLPFADFTLNAYLQLLRTSLASGYTFTGVSGHLSSPTLWSVILRHDVDRFPSRALDMARAECAMGICCTYYFRHTSRVFKPKIIRAIADLGHEIGYHYEVLADAKGSVNLARRLFADNLKKFRDICPVTTAAMHGRPFSPYMETDFWKNATLNEFGLTGEAFLSFAGCGFPYLTDTGRSWSSASCNIRDRIPAAQSLDGIASTAQLAEYIQQRQSTVLYLSAHPERWPRSNVGRVGSLFFDLTANFVKRAVRVARRVYY